MRATETRARRQPKATEVALGAVLDHIRDELANERADGRAWFIQDTDGMWRTDRPFTIAFERMRRARPRHFPVLERLLSGAAPVEAWSDVRPRPARPVVDSYVLARQVVIWAGNESRIARHRLPRNIGRGEASIGPLAARPRTEFGAPRTPHPVPAGRDCAYCGDPAAAMDHIWPRSRGGDDTPANLAPACVRCNGWKSNRSLLGLSCPTCGHVRHPGDVVTGTGDAYYACRCGATWKRRWALQSVPGMANWGDVPRPADIPMPTRGDDGV